MSTATDIATRLAAAGLGLTAGTNLFVNDMPTTPAAAVAVFDIPSPPPIRAMHNTQISQWRRFQIQSRSNKSVDAAALCQSCLAAMESGTVTIGSSVYDVILADGSAALLKRDENGLVTFYAEGRAAIR